MDKTRKIQSQNVRKLDLKDSKDVGKMHSENSKAKKPVCRSREGNHLMIGGTSMLNAFFNLSLKFKRQMRFHY